MGMRAKYVKKFKHTTKSNHKLPVAPNLLDREFNVTEMNKVWVGVLPILKQNAVAYI
jgi:transposase InsO family protein